MTRLEVRLVPCLSDNYAYLVHSPETGETIIVDPAEAGPVLTALDQTGWVLSHIFNTHHHGDHVGGNMALKEQFGIPIIGPLADKDRIPGIDVALDEGETYAFGGEQAHVLNTPAHTRGHISFYFPNSKLAFTGDTLFALGCGRLFEGSAAQMWQSLQKLMALPDDVEVFCGHEYTQSNARFAVTIEPGNAELIRRAAEIDELRAGGIPTIPTTIGLEKRTNPFLRPDSAEIQKVLGMTGKPLEAVFAEIRARKDSF